MSTFRAANGTETCTLSDVAVRKCDGDWQGERWLYPSSTDKPIQNLPTRGSERRVGENMCRTTSKRSRGPTAQPPRPRFSHRIYMQPNRPRGLRHRVSRPPHEGKPLRRATRPGSSPSNLLTSFTARQPYVRPRPSCRPCSRPRRSHISRSTLLSHCHITSAELWLKFSTHADFEIASA